MAILAPIRVASASAALKLADASVPAMMAAPMVDPAFSADRNASVPG